MKRGTTTHRKVFRLAAALKVPRTQAIGIWACVLDYVAEHAPDGDVTDHADTIAYACDWPDAEQLFATLHNVACIDRVASDEGRFVVHGWSEHAEDSVHTRLALKGLCFADGTKPNTRRLNKLQRARAERLMEQNRRCTTLHNNCREARVSLPLPLTLTLSRKTQAAKPPGVVQIPSSLDSDASFGTAWTDWLAYRRERKLTCTPRTLRAQLVTLEQVGPADACRIIRQSIEHGWIGLFPLRVTPNVKLTPHDRAAAQQAAIEDRIASMGRIRAERGIA